MFALTPSTEKGACNVGWFYEVDITHEVLTINEHIDEYERIIVQGKNSERDYEEYYMEKGKPYRYPALSELMPETSGSPDDIRLILGYGDPNKDGGFIDYKPVYFNGKWWAEEVERLVNDTPRSSEHSTKAKTSTKATPVNLNQESE